MSFFSKAKNLYNKGKEKIKEKIDSYKKPSTSKNNTINKTTNNNNYNNTNVKQTQNINLSQQDPETRLKSDQEKNNIVNEKKEQDIFKIVEDEGGKTFTYKIQDVDSDEEEETEDSDNNNNEENNNVKKEKNEYVVVDSKNNINNNNKNNIDGNIGNNKLIDNEKNPENNLKEEIQKFAAQIESERDDIFNYCHGILLKVRE